MRLLAAGSAAILFAASAAAQTARLSGRVIEQGRGTPVTGATVRLTGASARVTDSLGNFDFLDVIPGRYIVTVAAIGYRFRTIELVVSRDTTLAISMERRVVSLDTMLVLPRYVRIRGTAVDSATGDKLLHAQATIYPGGRFVGAMSGTFTFDSVAPGPVTIIVEGAEHLPVRVELEALRDTTLRVRMGVDSIALRMVAIQVRRLEKRSLAIPMPIRAINRDAIAREPTLSVDDLIARRLFEGAPQRGAAGLALDSCYFLDDMKVPRERYAGLLPELVERIEIYRSVGVAPVRGRSMPMIRVYTKRYVASLPRQETLPKVFYMPGRKVACA